MIGITLENYRSRDNTGIVHPCATSSPLRNYSDLPGPGTAAHPPRQFDQPAQHTQMSLLRPPSCKWRRTERASERPRAYTCWCVGACMRARVRGSVTPCAVFPPLPHAPSRRLCRCCSETLFRGETESRSRSRSRNAVESVNWGLQGRGVIDRETAVRSGAPRPLTLSRSLVLAGQCGAGGTEYRAS